MALSVPLRGLWFLSCLNGPYIQLSMFWCFPSPCGDYGSYLTILRNTRVRVLLSVPLRGLWFLSTTGNKPFIIIITLLSVPLRGLWFLSVCSTLYIAIYKALSFRPLAGIMVLIVIIPVCNNLACKTFRPLAGIMVLIELQKRISSEMESFRPLAGIMVLITRSH